MYQFSVFPCLNVSLHEHMYNDLLNDGSSKPVCLFTTWLGKELSCAKITCTLPDFSFKFIIDQGRKLQHIKAEKFAQKKFANYSPAFCLCRLHWLLSLRLDPTMDARINRKAVLPNSSCLNHEVIYQQNPLLFLKIQVSNEIIWFEMHKTDQRTPRQLSLLNALHVSLSRNRPIAFYVSSLQADNF